jgi:hypothetical protein
MCCGTRFAPPLWGGGAKLYRSWLHQDTREQGYQLS